MNRENLIKWLSWEKEQLKKNEIVQIRMNIHDQ